MNLVVDDLLEKDENIWLEFKSFWYWNEGEDPQKGWGEFLKDFVAIFNTYSIGVDKKYFIIGFNDSRLIHDSYTVSYGRVESLYQLFADRFSLNPTNSHPYRILIWGFAIQ